MKNRYIFVLITLYLVGILGFFSDYSEFFIKISYLQILTTSLIVLLNVMNLNLAFILRFLIVALFSFLIEFISVRTGCPFGNYYYADNLGYKFLGVPLLIALNWSLLIYSSKVMFSKIFTNNFLVAFFSASFLSFLDFLIEQSADSLGYWYWSDSIVPASNYIAWFCLAFIASSCLFRKEDCQYNQLAVVNLFLMTLFFLVLAFFFT